MVARPPPSESIYTDICITQEVDHTSCEIVNQWYHDGSKGVLGEVRRKNRPMGYLLQWSTKILHYILKVYYRVSY